jgi:L,D-transpeptidase ErfK/SrfK
VNHLKLKLVGLAVLAVGMALAGRDARAQAWERVDFAKRALFAYPMPQGRDSIIGSITTYRVDHGDTLLDVGRWFGLTAKEISDANRGLDWWSPPVRKEIILPTEHILPEGPRRGVVLNIPEMRLYYYHPAPEKLASAAGVVNRAAYRIDDEHSDSDIITRVVYTFPVGLGRYDWKTPVGKFKIRGKTRNPTWVLPDSIYQEHLERDGWAPKSIKGGDPENPLGMYRIELTLPMYALHGTNMPWGVGMKVSHGCVRLYPEDIERLFSKIRVGTPGEFIYQPVKFGWRGDALYVEVHDDIYGRYPGLYSHAVKEMKRRGLAEYVDHEKLERAIVEKRGIPVFVMHGMPPEFAG